jgi:hypothetical protein
MSDNRETVLPDRVSYYYSDARTLVDQGFVDAWCTWHYDIFEGGRQESHHGRNAAAVLFGFFGIFLGLTIGNCLALISSYFERFRNLVLCILLIVAGAYQTFFKWTQSMLSWYPHSGVFFSCMWGAALTALLLWMLFGRSIANTIAARREEKEKQKSTTADDVSGEML